MEPNSTRPPHLDMEPNCTAPPGYGTSGGYGLKQAVRITLKCILVLIYFQMHFGNLVQKYPLEVDTLGHCLKFKAKIFVHFLRKYFYYIYFSIGLQLHALRD